MTVTLKNVLCGTALHGEQAGVPAERCYLGWQKSLAQLVKLVTPEIPG